ncbi:MAG: hypothetical protein WBC04_04120 [Candidatus Acidiferrales bacterium]
MTESLTSSEPGNQKRRSTRVVRAVAITVAGVDALGQAFRESTTTVMVNCHGCKYRSKYYVPKNSIVTVEIPRSQSLLSPRIALGRVIWVQRPRTFQEVVHIGVEFEVPGNVWGIASPPEDWFPCSDEQAPAIAALSNTAGAAAVATPSGEGKIQVMRSAGQGHEAQPPYARQLAEIAEEEVTIEEMTAAGQQVDAQIYEAIEEIVKASIERFADSVVERIVQQAADHTAGIIEEARKACQATAEQLEAKVREALQETESTQQGRKGKKLPSRRQRNASKRKR